MDERIKKAGNDLITLIKGLLEDEIYILNNPNYDDILKVAKYHSLQNMLYYAINHRRDKINDNVPSHILKELTKINNISIGKAAMFDAEYSLIKDKLNENNIRFLPLKGLIIKNLYPVIDMRSMADMDIFFDAHYAKEVKKIMCDLGYIVKMYNQGNHDVYLKEPFLNVEMHRMLMAESYSMSMYYKELVNNNIFSKLIKQQGHEYHFSNEDYYIFMIAHAAKHFSNGGMGIRNVIDLYIFLKKYQNSLNFSYIREELEKLNVLKFNDNFVELSEYWFNNRKDLNIKLMEDFSDYIIDSGTYGNQNNVIIHQLIGEKEYKSIKMRRFAYIMHRLFPDVKTMKAIFPVLKKCILLLPIMYIIRIFKALCNKKKVKSELNSTKKIDENKTKKHKKFHDDIGV